MKIKVLLACALAFIQTSYAQTSLNPDNSGVTLHYASPLDQQDNPSEQEVKGVTLFPKKWITNHRRVFVFDPKHGAWAAYDDHGDRIKIGKASGGKSFCNDTNKPCRTPSGIYYVLSKGDANCRSSLFPLETHGGAPMPYCMMFTQSGDAIHGASNVPAHNASHGCVRVTPIAAKWLSENFIKVGTKVIIWPY